MWRQIGFPTHANQTFDSRQQRQQNVWHAKPFKSLFSGPTIILLHKKFIIYFALDYKNHAPMYLISPFGPIVPLPVAKRSLPLHVSTVGVSHCIPTQIPQADIENASDKAQCLQNKTTVTRLTYESQRQIQSKNNHNDKTWTKKRP